MEVSKVEIFDNTGIEVIQAQERAMVDSQVATAKMYPRSLTKVQSNSIAIACMSKDTAISCRYTKPAGNKKISGASVHLARIVVQQYGNIKVQQRIREITSKAIIAEAIAFDMETNYAVCVEARRSILDRNGNRFGDSLIETNAMAVMAIAERNAILKVIPKSIIDSVYDEAFKFANGNLSDKASLIIARDKAMKFFKDTYDVGEDLVLKSIGLKAIGAIEKEDIANLRSFIQGLKDKELTIEELFGIDEKQNREEPNNQKIEEQPEPTETKPVETVQI